jgi:hypothetical protein
VNEQRIPARRIAATVVAAAGCCAALACGCKPVQVIRPVVPDSFSPMALFSAPPAPSTTGAIVDPFAGPGFDPFDPNAAAPQAVMPLAGDPGGPSRIHVPSGNRDWTWEQIVDVFDDYFRVERERQVQVVGDVMTEGRIDGYPQIGATWLEPHRRDSVGRYNRWESTFQTIRRRASLRVIPDPTGYTVEATVEKDLEDLPRPENSTAGAATFRNDDSLDSDRDEFVSRTRLASNWILIGRDQPVEQRILADLQQRLAIQPTVAPAGFSGVAPSP